MRHPWRLFVVIGFGWITFGAVIALGWLQADQDKAAYHHTIKR